MRHLFRKPRVSRFIHYDQPNQEPPEHIEGKRRVRTILFGLGYTVMHNAPSFEYQLPSLTNWLGDITKDYTIDVLMYSALLKRVVAVEVDGDYHRKNREAIAKTKWKAEAIKQFLRDNRGIMLDGVEYKYVSWRFKSFEDDELVGKYAIKDIEIIKELT